VIETIRFGHTWLKLYDSATRPLANRIVSTTFLILLIFRMHTSNRSNIRISYRLWILLICICPTTTTTAAHSHATRAIPSDPPSGGHLDPQAGRP